MSFFIFDAMKNIFYRYALIIFCLLGCNSITRAEKVYDFNATCQQAYNEITSLKLISGQKLTAAARQQNPDNLIPDLLDSYIDFFVLFFNEDPAEYKIRKPRFDIRLRNLESGPKQSPFYNYCRSAVYIQEACIEIKFGERWAAGWDFRKAFTLIKENRKKFPAFTPNDMIFAPMQVVAGTIPDGYKWLAGLFGIKGSIKEGMSMMERFVNSNDAYAHLFNNEAAFYYCYLKFHIENKPDAVFKYIVDKKLDLVNNHLLAYMAANLGLNDRRNDYAKNVILKRNTSTEYLQTAVWDFEMGYLKMRHLELAEAAKYFENYASKFKGKFYLKDGLEKLSWCYYLQGNQTAANAARELVLKRGNSESDADIQALKDAKSGVWPTPILLKARLLNDGGYNKDALSLLSGKNANDFTKPEEQLEFTYRLARIYDDLEKTDEAIKIYAAAIKLGTGRPEYFAARAALQIGAIYEQQGKKDQAIVYYQQCLNMASHEYKDSIDQKAKAGIERCKGR